MARRLLDVLGENGNTFVFLAGFGLFVGGASISWSPGLASVAGGVILMAIAAWPYVVSRGLR